MLLAPAGADASESVPHGGGGVVSATGKVGPLELGLSTAVAVQQFAGRADFIGTGTFQVPGKPTFIALAYGCSAQRSDQRIDPTAYTPSHTYCRTVYYISNKTHQLEAFWTSSSAFHTFYGTVPGSTQAYANAHEDALPEFGCHRGLSRSTAVARLLMDNRGGRSRDQTYAGVTYTVAVVGGTVSDLELEARSDDVGLFFC